MSYTEKDWILVTPKIEYEGTLATGPYPVAAANGTRFRFVGQLGTHKLPCFNMVAENFMRIVELRKLTEIKALAYWWSYEPPRSLGTSGGWPQRMELAIIIDHRVPVAYRTPCPDLWADDPWLVPPTAVYEDMIAEAHKERFP